MSEWFSEHYISREDHREIVEFYKKQLVRLYREVCELRELAGREADLVVPSGGQPEETHPDMADDNVLLEPLAGNVVWVDFAHRKTFV